MARNKMPPFFKIYIYTIYIKIYMYNKIYTPFHIWVNSMSKKKKKEKRNYILDKENETYFKTLFKILFSLQLHGVINLYHYCVWIFNMSYSIIELFQLLHYCYFLKLL